MQLAITDPNGALTMSTREIAGLTGKEHKNVLRDARAMLAELHGEQGVLSFEQTYRDPQNGQTYPELALPKRECLILVTGYSMALRAKIIDRWQELEDQARNPAAIAANYSRMELLEMAMAAEKERLQLTHKFAELAPKAVALDRISKCIHAATRRSRMQQNAARRSGLQQPEHGPKPAHRPTGARARSCPETHLGLADARRCAGWRPGVRLEGASS